MSRPIHTIRRKRRGFRSNHYIRPYPYHGKFEGGDYTTMFAYDYSMESSDICSNEHAGGSASLVMGPFRSFDLLRWTDLVQWDNKGLTLNRAERRFIKRMAGAIVHESSDGFVDVRWYEDKNKLESVWESVQQSYYPEDEESDDSEG